MDIRLKQKATLSPCSTKDYGPKLSPEHEEERKEGRPLKFKSAKELETKIDAYFLACDQHVTKKYEIIKGKVFQIEVPEPLPQTLSGLAVALDCSRRTLLNYGKKDEYFSVIARAMARLEAFAEESLWKPRISAGVAFVLKNNYGWHDQSEVDHTTRGEAIRIYLPQRNAR